MTTMDTTTETPITGEQLERAAATFAALAAQAGRPELSRTGDLVHAFRNAPDVLDAAVDEIEQTAAHAIAQLRSLIDRQLPTSLAVQERRLRDQLADLETARAEAEERAASRVTSDGSPAQERRRQRAEARQVRENRVAAAEAAIAALAAEDRSQR